eukprot:g2780.t1
MAKPPSTKSAKAPGEASELCALERSSARAGERALALGPGALPGSGGSAGVLLRVGAGARAGGVLAHSAVLRARPPVFAAMVAGRWGRCGAGASSSSSSSSSSSGGGSSSSSATPPQPAARCTTTAGGVEPAASKELLRFVHTGSCTQGALAAMPGHLLGAPARHGVGALQGMPVRAMGTLVCVENVCNCFALAHMHGNQHLEDVCAELFFQNMAGVPRSAGSQRLATGRPALGAEIIRHMGLLSSPGARSRKRKREGEEEMGQAGGGGR